MKSIHAQFSACFRVALTLLFLSCIHEVFAKPKVVSSSRTTLTTKSRNGSASKRITYTLFGEGQYTWIKADAQGRTHVYVNQHGTGVYCDCDECEAELPSNIGWASVDIYAGKMVLNQETDSLTVRMDGGSVRSIVLSSSGNVKGNATLTVSGGSVETISVGNSKIQGSASVFLSDVRYTGSSPIRFDDLSKATLYVGNDCEFYADAARLPEAALVQFAGAIMPDPSDNNTMWTYGAACLPAGVNVECDYLYNRASGITFGAGSYIYIRKCNGLVSGSNSISEYSANVTQRSHNSIRVSQPATCTKKGYINLYCDMCNTLISHVLQVALGHDTVTDEAVEASCLAAGLTEGSHCGRCGKVFVAQEEIAKLSHNWGTTQSVLLPCFSTTTKQSVQICSQCLSMKIIKLSGSLSLTTVKHLNAGKSLSTTVGPSGISNKNLTKLLENKKFNRPATCTQPGITTTFCTTCQFITAKSIAAKNHSSKTVHEAVAATCETSGNEYYSVCDDCATMFKADSTTFNELDDVYLQPTMHQYGVSDSYKQSDLTLVSEATCSEPAIYRQSCAHCGKISDALIFYGAAATGHSYHLKSIDYKDSDYPDEGIVTIECSKCSRTWPYFQYALYDQVGKPADDGTYQGYWYKTQLLSTDSMPTCRPGWGTYHLDINFHGTLMSTTFDNYITPMGYAHHYDDDGVCREQHKLMEYNQDGSIHKTCAGEITYRNFASTQSVDVEYHTDSAVYSTQGFIAVPYQTPCLDASGNVQLDPTDQSGGTPLYYTDYRVTQAADQASFYSAMTSQTEPFYANFYDDFAMDICTTSDDMLGTMSGCTEASVKNNVANLQNLDMHGHQIYAYLNDGTVVQTSPSQSVQKVRYNRTFNNTNWQALYVPIDMTVADLQLAGISRIAEITEVTETNGALSITIQDIENGWTTPRGIYLVKVDEPGQKSVDISNCSVRYSATPTTKSFETESYTVSFVGTNDEVSGTTMYDNHYYALGEGKLAPAANSSVSLKPQRWYMSVTDKNGVSEVPSIRIVGFENEEESTALQTIRETVVENRVYTMDGRKVLNSESLTPGIYVQNGRRILIK